VALCVCAVPRVSLFSHVPVSRNVQAMATGLQLSLWMGKRGSIYRSCGVRVDTESLLRVREQQIKPDDAVFEPYYFVVNSILCHGVTLLSVCNNLDVKNRPGPDDRYFQLS
jgi:hypothetical protein